MTQRSSEFEPLPVVPQPVLQGPLAGLLEWQAMAEGAYSANTLRAQKADGAIFQAFCESRGERYLPADPKSIRGFIEDRVKAGKRQATIKTSGSVDWDAGAIGSTREWALNASRRRAGSRRTGY